VKTLLALFLSAGAILWRDPGDVARIDFMKPAGSAPAPVAPFQFIEEDAAGTSAKVLVRDANGKVWRIKGGPEARAEAFVTRLVSALGYFAETTVFMANGRIQAVPNSLGRASYFVNRDGSFTWASLEYRDSHARFLPKLVWRWQDNPFAGSHELNGLKILMMLVSNWDNKDARDNHRGSNTGVLDVNGEHVYFVTDWGQSLGAWGGLWGRSNWNCADYEKQTPSLVVRVAGDRVVFGYHGQHSADFWRDIKVSDVQWLMTRLGAVTDAQIRSGFLASGATPEEEACFSRALRKRIERLREVARTAVP
jgi:hypothetical protein